VTCQICVHATEHGSWPPDHRGTHCLDCCRSWSGFREAHCVDCHQHFSSDILADKHRIGYECLTVEEMLETVSQNGKLVFRQCDTRNGKIWRYAETLPTKPAFLTVKASA